MPAVAELLAPASAHKLAALKAELRQHEDEAPAAPAAAVTL